MLSAYALGEILELAHRDSRGIVIKQVAIHRNDVADLAAVGQVLRLPVASKEDEDPVFIVGFGIEFVAENE